jgi:hypothetical protein
MPPLLRLALPLFALAACAVSVHTSPGVDLDRFRGVYTTHFEGIPDRAAVCALVTNRSGSGIDWLRLRLESDSQLGEEPGHWVSYWLWEGRLDPGGSVALALEDPPMADQIRLDLGGSGSGKPRRAGRTARRISRCSETALQARLEKPGGRVLAVARRNEGARDEILVADHPDP